MNKEKCGALLILLFWGCTLSPDVNKLKVDCSIDTEKNIAYISFSEPYSSDDKSKIIVDDQPYDFRKNYNLTTEKNITIVLDNMNKHWFTVKKISVIDFKTKGLFNTWFPSTVFYIKDIVKNVFANMEIVPIGQNKLQLNIILPYEIDVENSRDFNGYIYLRYPIENYITPKDEINIPLTASNVTIQNNVVSCVIDYPPYNINSYLVSIKNLLSREGNKYNFYVQNVVNNATLPQISVVSTSLVLKLPSNIEFFFQTNEKNFNISLIRYTNIIITKEDIRPRNSNWILLKFSSSVYDSINLYYNDKKIDTYIEKYGDDGFMFFYNLTNIGSVTIKIMANAGGFIPRSGSFDIQIDPPVLTNVGHVGVLNFSSKRVSNISALLRDVEYEFTVTNDTSQLLVDSRIEYDGISPLLFVYKTLYYTRPMNGMIGVLPATGSVKITYSVTNNIVYASYKIRAIESVLSHISYMLAPQNGSILNLPGMKTSNIIVASINSSITEDLKITNTNSWLLKKPIICMKDYVVNSQTFTTNKSLTFQEYKDLQYSANKTSCNFYSKSDSKTNIYTISNCVYNTSNYLGNISLGDSANVYNVYYENEIKKSFVINMNNIIISNSLYFIFTNNTFTLLRGAFSPLIVTITNADDFLSSGELNVMWR